MESRRIYDQLISDPEEIKQLFETTPELQKFRAGRIRQI